MQAATALFVLVLGACAGEGSDPDTMMMTSDSAVMKDSALMQQEDASVQQEDASVTVEDSAVPKQDGSAEEEDDGGGVIGPGKSCPDGLELERGECVETCNSLGIEELDCGVGGFCGRSIKNATEPFCYCDDGYKGLHCETCDTGFVAADGGTCTLTSPTEVGMRLWLDADTLWTLDMPDDKVQGWRDRRAPVNQSAKAPFASSKPVFLAEYRNGRGALEFDGTDDRLVLEDFTGIGGPDFEVIWAGEPRGNVTGVMGATSGDSNWAFMVNRVPASNNFQMIIRDPAGSTGGTTILLERETQIRPMYLAAGRKTSSSPDSLILLGSDVTNGQSLKSHLYVTVENSLDSPLDFELGRTQVGAFEGILYEVIVYNRRLSVQEREEVTNYLRGKWNLP